MVGRRTIEGSGEVWALRAHGEVAKLVDGEEGLTWRPWMKLRRMRPNIEVRGAVKERAGWSTSGSIAR